jgi:hypothetical protein
MGGRITLTSRPGIGTLVQIDLPVAAKKSLIDIEVTANTQLVFVDDDPLIHSVWRKILPPNLLAGRAKFLFSGKDLRDSATNGMVRETIYFIDNDLSPEGAETGMELIEELSLQESAYLVTGRAKEKGFRSLARRKNIRVIDKAELDEIRFHVTGISNAKLILIDDSRACRLAWHGQADQANMSMESFASVQEFFGAKPDFELATPIYVDYILNGQIGGPAVVKSLTEAGFTNVFIATAFAKTKVIAPAGIRGVVGKEFPIAPFPY